jgi:hypothetical protein
MNNIDFSTDGKYTSSDLVTILNEKFNKIFNIKEDQGENKMQEKSWKEFKDAGLLWWINMILHTFGWAIVFAYEEDSNTIMKVYPARVGFRGFEEEINSEGYIKVSKYLLDNIVAIEKETH